MLHLEFEYYASCDNHQYNLLKDFTPDESMREQMAEDYAVRYTPGVDAGFFWRNMRWLGNL